MAVSESEQQHQAQNSKSTQEQVDSQDSDSLNSFLPQHEMDSSQASSVSTQLVMSVLHNLQEIVLLDLQMDSSHSVMLLVDSHPQVGFLGIVLQIDSV